MDQNWKSPNQYATDAVSELSKTVRDILALIEQESNATLDRTKTPIQALKDFIHQIKSQRHEQPPTKTELDTKAVDDLIQRLARERDNALLQAREANEAMHQAAAKHQEATNLHEARIQVLLRRISELQQREAISLEKAASTSEHYRSSNNASRQTKNQQEWHSPLTRTPSPRYETGDGTITQENFLKNILRALEDPAENHPEPRTAPRIKPENPRRDISPLIILMEMLAEESSRSPGQNRFLKDGHFNFR